jgi:hypothetical protein
LSFNFGFFVTKINMIRLKNKSMNNHLFYEPKRVHFDD